MISKIKKPVSILLSLVMVISLFTIVPFTASAATASFVKVTEEPEDWSGEYLIVYEDENGNKAFDGFDPNSAGNYIGVTISNGEIASDNSTNAAKVTIAQIDGGYSIKTTYGTYIGGQSGANKIVTSSDAILNTISLDDEDYAVIVSNETYFRYNTGWGGFRYYKSASYASQQPVCLYKLESGSTPAGETITLDLNADNATITWDDSTAEDEYWRIDADYDDGKKSLTLTADDVTQAAGTFTIGEEMSASSCGIVDLNGGDGVQFDAGSCTVTVDGDTVTIEGSFTGSDGNTYNVTITYVAPTYTITWKNYDDTEIGTSTVNAGETPAFSDEIGEIKAKPEDDDYTYTFSGWTPELTAATADAEYTATFDATPKAVPAKLTINVGENGKVVMNNGTFGNATDASNITEIPAPINVTDGNKVFIVDDHTANLVEGGSINIATGGEVSFYPSADNTGVITAIPDDDYVCSGWYEGDELYTADATLNYKDIDEDITLTAKFAPIPKYTVTWMNGDTELEVDTGVAEGANPEYNGATPQKPDDATNYYTFSGWDPEVSAVTGDETYTAQFTATEKPAVIKDCNNNYGDFRLYSNVPIVSFSNVNDLLTGAIIPITYGDGNTIVPLTDAKGYSYKLYNQSGTEIPFEITSSKSEPGSGYELSDDVTVYTNVLEWTLPANINALYIVATEPAPTSGSFDGLTWNIDEEGTLTFSGSGAIPMNAFKQNEDIKKVIINDSVTALGPYAFEECPNLTEVEIQNPSVSLSDTSHQFNYCESLTTVTLPEGMTLIPQGMFRNCTALTTVDLPSTITTIEDMAFMDSGLQSISVPEGATYQFSSFMTNSLQSLTLEGRSPMTFTGRELTFLSDEATVYIPEGSKYVYSTTTATLYAKNEMAEMFLDDAQSNLNRYIQNSFSPEEALERVNDSYSWTGNDPFGMNVTTEGPFTVELNEGDKCAAVFGGATIGKYVPPAPTYTITWKNDDGTVIDTTTVVYGDTPTHADPSKAFDKYYTYTFAGWTPEITAVTGDAEYTAQFTPVAKTFMVFVKRPTGSTINVYDLTGETTVAQLKAIIAEKENIPVTEQNLIFAGTQLEDEKTLAEYNIEKESTLHLVLNTYTVTWMVGEEIVETDENVPYGTTPEYNGEQPTKASTAEFDYAFIGWDPEIDTVTGDITYTAVFSSTTRSYTVTWKNGDEVLETDENVPYGTTPEFNGEQPTKDSTDEFDYAFIGWDPEINTVTGDITYTAVFSSTTRSYTVTWKNGDEVLETDENVPYGTTPEYNGEQPTKESDGEYIYTFAGWDPEIDTVTGNVTYTAVFDSAPDYSGCIIGDVNLDGVVDILDATMIQKYSVEKVTLTDKQKYVADVNNDGFIDVLDATDIQKFTVDKITEFEKKA